MSGRTLPAMEIGLVLQAADTACPTETRPVSDTGTWVSVVSGNDIVPSP